MDCTELLVTLLKKYTKVDLENEKWDNNINLEHDLGIDSIMLLKLVVDIEEMFNITVADEELDADVIGTIGGMLELIKLKVSGENEYD